MRFVRCGELINNLHHRFKRSRFVAVNRVSHPRDCRIILNNGVCIAWRSSARIGQTRICGFDFVQTRNILRRRNRHDVLHSIFVSQTDVENAHTVRRSFGDFVNHFFHLCVSRMMIADIKTQNGLRTRNFRSIFAARVKIKFFLRLRETKLCKKTEKDSQQNAFYFHL